MQNANKSAPKSGVRRYFWQTSVVLLTLCTNAFAQAAGDTLTLAAALEAAERRSYALSAQSAAAAAATDKAVAAETLPDPTLRLSLDNLPIDGPMRFSLGDDLMTMSSIGLSQTWVRHEKRSARSLRQERAADVALAQRDTHLSQLRRATSLAWFDRHFQQQWLALLERQRDEAALLVDAAQAAYRSAMGPQADIFVAQSAVAQIDDQLIQTGNRLRNAKTHLRRWIGALATAPLATAPDFAHTPMGDHALAHRLELHPHIALMAAREVEALAAADVARAEKRADWSVSVMYSRRGAQFSNMFSVGVSVPLQWNQGNRQDRELAATLARAEMARDERLELEREHRADTQHWLDSWRSELERLDHYDQRLVPLAAQRTAATLAAYRGNTGSLRQVVEARMAEVGTRIDRLKVEMGAAGLWVELESLVVDKSLLVDARPKPLTENLESMR